MYNNRVSIQEILARFKGSLRSTELFLSVLIVIVSLASFGLGRLSMQEKLDSVSAETIQAFSLENNEKDIIINATSSVTPLSTDNASPGGYVASKNGSKYHLPWCAGAKQMKEENKIWFVSKEEAEAAGYTPAANCKGI